MFITVSAQEARWRHIIYIELTLLTFLSMGDSVDDILENWPWLKREAVLEALSYAAEMVLDQYPRAEEIE